MLTNNEIKYLKSLQTKKFRKENGVFVAEGEKLVTDILQSELKVQQVLHTELWRNPSAGKSILTQQISLKEMERITGLVTPSNAFAVVEYPNYAVTTNELNNQLVLMLDGVQDPGNMGTIIRLADWFGIDNIICSPDTADAFAPKVIQASMGAIARVRVSYYDLPHFLHNFNGNSPIYGTFMQGDNIYSANLETKGIIVLGSEGSGISRDVERFVTQRIQIPSFAVNRSTVESLNVAMTTAIICSEFCRRTVN